MASFDTEEGELNFDEFDFGISFSDDNDDGVVSAVKSTITSSATDLGPVIDKLNAIIALIPVDGIENGIAPVAVDLSTLEHKLDTIIALERVDALTAGDMPDMSGIESKLDSIFECTHTHSHTDEAPVVDFTILTEKLETLETTIGEVRELDFNGDGLVDFGDINNNLADLLARQEVVENELETKKAEFETFKATKLQAMAKLILPLLNNLKKSPDKPYIHWPNRTGVLDAQMGKIKQIAGIK